MKRKIIFMHIPKNGGSTLRPVLLRHFKPEETFTIRLIGNDKLNTDEFIQMPVEKRAKIKFLQGHTNFGIHQHMDGMASYVALLRNPVDRVISFYYYVRSLPGHRLYATIVKNNMTLYDFALNINQGDVNNGQIRYISGIHDKPEIMLEKALENADLHFPVIGFLERYDESLILFKKEYQLKTPYYRIANKTKKREDIQEVSADTINLIKELNSADFYFYEQMEKRFNKQIQDLGPRELRSELNKLRHSNKIYNSVLYVKGELFFKRMKEIIR